MAKQGRKTTQKQVAKKLSKLYSDPAHPAGYGVVAGIKRVLPKTVRSQDIRTWLSGQESYTLHRRVKRRFPRRRVIVGGVGHQWQADLVDVSAYSKDNDAVRFLLTVTDVFSKFAWVRPLTSKTGAAVCAGFQSIISKKRKPSYLSTDKGLEFRNGKVQSLFEQYDIKHFTSENDDIKASVVERFNQTLQTKLHRYMTGKHTRRYLDVLQSLVKSYNSTKHRSLGMAPQDVTHENSEIVWHTMYPYDEELWKTKNDSQLKAQDYVRISKTRKTFQKGYLGQWSKEIFRVVRVNRTTPRTYNLEDMKGDEIRGTFYIQELQQIRPPTYHDVETILDRRVRRGQPEYLVRWVGYSKAFDSWLPASQLKAL